MNNDDNNRSAKKDIQTAIKAFDSGSLTGNALHLFDALGYNTVRQAPFDKKTYAEFKDNYGHAFAEKKFSEEKALAKEWKSVDLLFQLTKDEVSGQLSLFDTKQVDNTIIETYLFFAVELTKQEYTRTAIAQITREINKVFPMPVMLLFRHGGNLTLSVINRRLNKKDEQKDVLEKVTLIKDIAIQNPHRAHIEILFDLSMEELKQTYKVANFVELHNAWQKTLDTRELNKRFYRELSNWYFWAVSNVSFPNDVDDDKDDTVFNSESVIRLLTRLIFIWFIKEKNLIPETIFDKKEVTKLIKGFNAADSTVYYRAILQNLFFATLNQKIEEREFATDGTFEQNKKNYGIKNLYRYSSDFAISKAEVIKLFAGVPFLNGGLFDCLDFDDKNGKVFYMDGFSRNPHKQAQVPDELFFAQEKAIDLSSIYDDKKKNHERVRGLFEIFNSYKFTITENTPIEEEVALDPELLGRVFENLLASYNPETKTTARKQTGSFYTPREIVNYMVDESLKAYLKQKLETEADMNPEDADVGLEFLLGYNEREHLFDKKQTDVLIKAIDNCKILDPACGSGAFPMGILHKLVLILHKLDPKNKQWKEIQIQKVDHLIKDAGNISDSAFKDKIIADLEINKQDIEESFNNNELDYGRKLYLIENCIYGVDIQPIATQISKLRFFISLIVDQKADKSRYNFGIRPLPNLETKFVAANTLVGIEKGFLRNIELDKLEEKLKDVRHRIFSTKSPAIKKKLREEDKVLREEITELLINDGWNRESASQLAAWDPYDQNSSSPWFDSEWMFGITVGFDIVIGNPPYINLKRISANHRNIYWSHYKEILSGDMDLYQLFFYYSIKYLLNDLGYLSFITPDSFFVNQSFSKLRNYILNNTTIKSIVSFPHRFFPFAIVNTETAITNLIKQQINAQYVNICISGKEYINTIPQKRIQLPAINGNNGFYINLSKVSMKALENCSMKKLDFNKFFVVSNPSSLDRKERYPITPKSNYSSCLFTQNDLNSDADLKNICKPCITGDKILRYKIHGENIFTNVEWIRDNKIVTINRETMKLMNQNKLIGQRITGQAKWRMVFTFDQHKLITMPSVNIINSVSDNDTDHKLLNLLAVLNSKIYNFLYKDIFGESNTNITSDVFNIILMPRELTQNQLLLHSISRYIIYLKSIDDTVISLYFESLIDAMVYELYFPEDIKVANAGVLKYLGAIPELQDDWSDEKKLEIIEKLYQELSDSKHPVSLAMAKQKTVPEIRIIEGLDKS